MEKKQNVGSIIEEWIGRLLDEHGVSSLDDLPIEVLEAEISQVKGTIANCKVWDDPIGALLSNEYIELLEEARDKKKPMEPQAYIAKQLREKMNTYAVDITELFQKTVTVKAANGEDAVEIVRKKYFEDEVMLTVDDDFVETQFRLMGEVKC